MGITSVYEGTQTAVIDTPHSLASTSGAGAYVLEIDLTEMESGDSIDITIKTQVLSTETESVAVFETLSDAQGTPNWFSVPIPLAEGKTISCILEQTTGTGRDFPWCLMRA